MRKKRVVFKETEILNIMKIIIENKIVNVKYFVNNEYNLRYDIYNKKLERIKEKYPDIYIDYQDNLSNSFNEFKDTAKLVMFYMIYLDNNGIELKDGSYRKFDSFDFYILRNKYFENFHKKELIPIFDEMKRDYLLFYPELKTDQIRFWINCSSNFHIDSYENIDFPYSKYSILKTQDELTNEEKEYLISFMDENNIPYTFGNYKFGVSKLIKQRENDNDYFNINYDIVKFKTKAKII